MILKTLYLHNFRLFEKTPSIQFSDGVNFFFGKNAQGKTTILEAIYLLSTGRSFRTNNLFDLIKEDQNYFYIEAVFEKDNTLNTISFYLDKSKKTKKLKINKTSYNSLNALLGNMLCVISSPCDFSIINGSPSYRRRFLNLFISQHDKNYLFHLARYSKALKQRNQLLKDKNLTTINVWEKELAISSAYITLKRAEILKKLSIMTQNHLKKISNKEKFLSIKYIPTINMFEDNLKNDTGSLASTLEKKYLYQFEKNREKELILKSTITGPHRDDFSFFLDDREAKDFASEGQKKSILTSLKLSEFNYLKDLTNLTKNSNQTPIMCFDDYDIFLDPTRKELLNKQIFHNNSQVFLSSANLDSANRESLKNKYFEVHDGKILESSFSTNLDSLV